MVEWVLNSNLWKLNLSIIGRKFVLWTAFKSQQLLKHNLFALDNMQQRSAEHTNARRRGLTLCRRPCRKKQWPRWPRSCRPWNLPELDSARHLSVPRGRLYRTNPSFVTGMIKWPLDNPKTIIAIIWLKGLYSQVLISGHPISGHFWVCISQFMAIL